MPFGHASQAALLDAPVLGLKVPACRTRRDHMLPRHDAVGAWQLGWPFSIDRRRTGHCSKVMLALAAPTLAQKPPTGQGLQLLAPTEALKLPLAHAAHAV